MEKNYKIKITSLAQLDLENIFEYFSIKLADFNVASRMITSFENSFNNLKLFLEMYPSTNNEFMKDNSVRK